MPAYPSAPLVHVEEPFHRSMYKNPKVSKLIDVCAEGTAEHWANWGNGYVASLFFHSPPYDAKFTPWRGHTASLKPQTVIHPGILLEEPFGSGQERKADTIQRLDFYLYSLTRFP